MDASDVPVFGLIESLKHSESTALCKAWWVHCTSYGHVEQYSKDVFQAGT